tara:strand:+ start:74 stop:283 length:210 start_codon:yes stop_codon:yes gene_type:complete
LTAHAHREVTLGQETMAIGDNPMSELYLQATGKEANPSSEFLERNRSHEECTYTRAQYGIFQRLKFNIL